MLKVNGAGVIKVRYISETAFCDRPLIKPKAPNPLMIKVMTKRIKLIHDFVNCFISFTSLVYFFNNGIPKFDVKF